MRTPPLSDTGIYEQIVEAILAHRLPPGMRLTEEKLGQAFGVSRTRIRQVLVRLASERLVTLIPNRGASVASPTMTEAREVFDARRLVEVPLLDAYMQRARSEDHSALASLIDQERAAHAAGERRSAIRLSGQFHLEMAGRAGNATLEKILRELVSRTSLILMAFSPQGAYGCGCTEHHSLLTAMTSGDGATARRLMRRHLSHIENVLDFTPASEMESDFGVLLGLHA
jgi:DNA-binding GntR family transcriptional regulator